jgi:NADPH2:quinone reductase
MRAVQLSRFGPPDVLEIVDVPTPIPAPGEVLVRVRASGVNFFETLMRQDRYAVTPELPMIFGVEVAGVIEALGDGVARSLLGARVAVPMFAVGRGSGGYAERLAIDAASAVPIPDDLSFEDATALMVQGLTALHLVRQSPPVGKTVLVNAAAGGVGSLLVQLAKRAGAKLIVATASTNEKLDFARSIGADAGVDYTAPDWVARVRDATGGAGADIVYELVGGAVTRASLDALAPRGELVFGALGRFDLDASDLEKMILRNQSLRGFALLPLLTPAVLKSSLTELFDLAASGELKVIQGGRYPLDQVAEAHRAIEERRTTGKVVLVP